MAIVGMVCLVMGGCAARQPREIGANTRLVVAEAAEAAGDLTLARSIYAAAAAEPGGDQALQIRAAEGLARSGAPADAMSSLEAAVRRLPNDHDTRRALGSLQLANGLPVQAEMNLAAVVAARPTDETARINLGVALDMLARHAEAQPHYRAVLANAPSDMGAANNLAMSLILSGQQAEARAVLAPFRGRANLPESMRKSMAIAEGAAIAAGSPGMAALARTPGDPAAGTPIPLYPPGSPRSRRR